MSLTISHTTKSYPRLPYEKIKNEILGNKYSLSLVFLGETRAQKLNQETRKKNYVPNVLSFELDKSAGEIFITPAVARREAAGFDHTYNEHICYLFIHGLLHLKGLDHGPKMDKLEEKYLNKYNK